MDSGHFLSHSDELLTEMISSNSPPQTGTLRHGAGQEGVRVPTRAPVQKPLLPSVASTLFGHTGHSRQPRQASEAREGTAAHALRVPVFL